jgi:hypothetical protein
MAKCNTSSTSYNNIRKKKKTSLFPEEYALHGLE